MRYQIPAERSKQVYKATCLTEVCPLPKDIDNKYTFESTPRKLHRILQSHGICGKGRSRGSDVTRFALKLFIGLPLKLLCVMCYSNEKMSACLKFI